MKYASRLLFIVALLLSLHARAAEPDWHEYDALLVQYVRPARHSGVDLNWVNYSGLKRDARWGRVVAQIEGFPRSQLASREEQLAFHINAYNVFAIRMVLDHWPVKSIKDAGSLLNAVWKKPAGKLDGQTVSLDEIEHGILRPLAEARVHMAVVCASISCPDLRTEAYRAERLDAQLEDQSRRFLANPGKGLAVNGRDLRVSKIFHWFDQDFDAAYGGPLGFIHKHARLPADVAIRNYQPYDWSLNGE